MKQSNLSLRSLRFSIAAMLLLAACVAGLLFGYRTGFDNGYADGMEKRFAEQPHVTIYPLATVFESLDISESEMEDLGIGRLDLLFHAIESTVEPDSWEALGGDGTILPMGESAVAINQRSYVHEQIEALLSDTNRATEVIGYSRDELVRMAQWRKPAMQSNSDQGKESMETPTTQNEETAEP